MEFRGLMGGLYRISEWIMRLAVINVLWVITSLPVFFFLFMILFTTDAAQLQTTLFIVGVLSPFILFPSTTAMFGVARKWVMGDEDVPLFKTFFRGYKDNYKQSMIGGILFILLLTVLLFNFRFYSVQSGFPGMLTYLFIALAVLTIIAIFNYFCITVHLHMKSWQLIKNACLITIGQPLRSLLIGITNVGILYISFYHITFLIPFFMGSLIAFTTFWHFYNGFRKLMDRYQKVQEPGDEADEEDGATASKSADKSNEK